MCIPKTERQLSLYVFSLNQALFDNNLCVLGVIKQDFCSTADANKYRFVCHKFYIMSDKGCTKMVSGLRTYYHA